MSEQSEPIKWAELTDKDKVRLLLEKVMGCFAFEETVKGYHVPEFPKGVQAPAGFHWPIAFWITDCDSWVYKDISDNNVTFFDPLHCLDDAWLIMDHIKPGRSGETSEEAFLIRARFVAQLEAMHSWWSWTREKLCEAICIAVLQSVGVEVEI